MGRKRRTDLALVLLVAAVVLNVAILVQDDVSVGLPLAAIVLLGAAGISLLAERRPL